MYVPTQQVFSLQEPPWFQTEDLYIQVSDTTRFAGSPQTDTSLGVAVVVDEGLHVISVPQSGGLSSPFPWSCVPELGVMFGPFLWCKLLTPGSF